MNIGIDCRFWGPKHTGLGRYTKSLILKLLEIDKKNTYVLFLREEDFQESGIRNQELGRVKLIQADFPHYSFKEQFLMPSLIKKARVDLMHFPHFNIPVFYKGKFVVTIHDLIKSQYRGSATTTHNSLIYYFKYLNYRLVIKKALTGAGRVITPSKFVKKQIIKNYKIEPSKIKAIYEGAGEMFRKKSEVSKDKTQNLLLKYKIKKPYLLYVGNLYPHKNIIRLIKVLNLINKTQKISLVIVSAKDKFYKNLEEKVMKKGAGYFVNFVDFVPDKELKILYKEALAFINPSLMEGFGLPGLEALSSGCLVLSSNQGSLPEIYKEAATYFNPEDLKDMEEKIKRTIALGAGAREKRIREGLVVARQYSWKKCAQETLRVYEKALK